MNGLNRRQFVIGCACAVCPAVQLLAEAPSEKTKPVDAGPLDRFKAEGIHDPQGRGRPFFLVNRAGLLYAVSATCTHKSVGLTIKGEGFKCPRHGSAFTADGRVTKAPARKSLPRYGIRVDEQGRVIVDVASVFGQSRWDEPASFVVVDQR